MSYQTARTLSKGAIQGAAAVSWGETLPARGSTDSGFMVEALVRYGLLEDLDGGLRITLPPIPAAVTLGVDFKYQLLETQSFAWAVGTGLSYALASQEGFSGHPHSSPADFSSTLYFSYDALGWLTAYLSPRYTYRHNSIANDRHQNYLGGSVGVQLGRRMGVFIEGAYLASLGEFEDIHQGGVAFFVTEN